MTTRSSLALPHQKKVSKNKKEFVFFRSPLPCITAEAWGALESSAVVSKKPCTDWSRKSRHNLALLKAGSSNGQTKLTSFIEVVEKISELITNAEPQYNAILLAKDSFRQRHAESISPLFEQLLRNAEQNIEKVPKQIYSSNFTGGTTLCKHCTEDSLSSI